MALRRIFLACFFVCVFAASAVAAEVSRVTMVPTSDGFTLWLPDRTPVKDQLAALGLSHGFARTWEGFFGTRPAVPDPLVVPPSKDLRDGLFQALWQHASESLEPADQPAALAAFRFLILDDASGLQEELAPTILRGRIGTLPLTGPLLYIFLKENVRESYFLQQALPPGPDGARLKAALAARGTPWDLFRNRFVAWMYSWAIESRLILPPAGSLPAVWMPEGDLEPGEISLWRFILDDADEGVDVDVAVEPEQGLLVMSYYTDEAGRPVQAGLSELKSGRMAFPRQGRTLWLLLWNTASYRAGAGLALTIWKDFQSAFTVKQASLKGSQCDLLIDEAPGIAEYEIAPCGAKGKSLSAPYTFLSEGDGMHHYHVRFPGSVSNAVSLRLTCRTASGGSLSANVLLTEPSSP
jgi:hypothetical protein